jgi:WhiB family redox-sensing transcriptional regulator
MRVSREEFREIEQRARNTPKLKEPVRQEQQEWMEQGSCYHGGPRISDLFFPGSGRSSEEAKGICLNCKVRLPCLEYALQDPGIVGVWGGTTGRERARIRVKRRRTEVA